MSVLFTEDELTTEEIELRNYAYSRTVDLISFDKMKLRLGHDRAVAFERQFQGIAELEEQKREALNRANDIRGALVRYVSLTGHEAATMADRGRCTFCASKRDSDACYCRYCSECARYYVSNTLRDSDDGLPHKEDCPQCSPLPRWPKGIRNNVPPVTPLQAALALPVWNHGDFFWIATDSAIAVRVAREVTHCDVYDETNSCVLTADQAATRLSNEHYGEHEHFGLVTDEVLSCFLESWAIGLFPELEA